MSFLFCFTRAESSNVTNSNSMMMPLNRTNHHHHHHHPHPHHHRMHTRNVSSTSNVDHHPTGYSNTLLPHRSLSHDSLDESSATNHNLPLLLSPVGGENGDNPGMQQQSTATTSHGGVGSDPQLLLPGPNPDGSTPLLGAEHFTSTLANHKGLKFEEEPADSYIVRSKSAILRCKTLNALNAWFSCNSGKFVYSCVSECVEQIQVSNSFNRPTNSR